MSSTGSGNDGWHILVVDDEDLVRDLFKLNLEEQGFVCHTAARGEEALQVLDRETVDLALVDMMMPGMTGDTLFKQIRERHPEVGIVFVTGVDDPKMAVKHLKDGAQDYVVKPITRGTLLQTVEDALQRRDVELSKAHHWVVLEQQVASQELRLDHRQREVQNLNRLLHEKLSERFSAEEAASVPANLGSRRSLRQGFALAQEYAKKSVADYLRRHVQAKLLLLRYRVEQSRDLVTSDAAAASILLDEVLTDLGTIQEHDIRRATHALYPPMIRVGLSHALKNLCRRLTNMVPIQLYVDPVIEEGEERGRRVFPEELRLGAYRIAEEALDNTVRHSGATRAWVCLSYQRGGQVSLELGDNGRGFQADELPSALGFLFMEDYATALGGSCAIESGQGSVTRVLAMFPVPAARSEAASQAPPKS